VQASAGSNGSAFPYTSPSDFIPVNDAGALAPFPGEWYFQATASVSVSDFSAEAGILRLHTFVQADMNDTLMLSGRAKDAEYRSYYDAGSTASGYRPSSAAQPLSGVARHKAFTAAIARSVTDTTLYRRGELVLLVFSEYLELSEKNAIVFPASASTSSLSVYRTSNLLIVP